MVGGNGGPTRLEHEDGRRLLGVPVQQQRPRHHNEATARLRLGLRGLGLEEINIRSQASWATLVQDPAQPPGRQRIQAIAWRPMPVRQNQRPGRDGVHSNLCGRYMLLR